MLRNACAFILIQIIIGFNAYAQEPIIFKGDNIIIGQNTAILEDTSNRLKLADIRASKDFVNSTTQTPSMPLSKSSFWIRFTIKNVTPENVLLLDLEYPTLQVCEFYSPKGNGFTVDKISSQDPFKNRNYKHQNCVFNVPLLSDSTATFYLKVSSNEQMVLPLILGTPKEIAESMLVKDLLWGILIGILLVMILYNFFVYLSTKDISYLYYVLYSIFIGLTQTSLSGYTYRYIFYDSPELFHMGIVIFPALAGISAMFFVKSFLHSKENTPILDKVFIVCIIFYSIAITLRLLGYDHVAYRMIDISALLTTTVIYSISIKRVIQGYRPAKFFLIAWSMFFLGLVLFILRNLGVLPYNIFTNYTMQMGAALEVTLLSIALADKINILKNEKEMSQLAALNASMENERIIREQNMILEQRVQERTFELNETNEDLSKTLSDLKQTQSQLVESEKMASLGQLTAGIAHEINNPINFVTSNVNPLKRDVAMVFDAINFIETIGLSNISETEKRAQIEEYKEELDYDYLKEEINHLLNGIYEGSSRTAEIVKGLRVFSRVDEDDLKRANLNEGIESTLIIINNLLNDTIRIERAFDNEMPPIECYPGKLNQVFLNIITNAIHAIRSKFGDKPEGLIKIKTENFEDYVLVTISDNGMGMDEATQHKIYEPFFTTKEVGEGTGLGMSIVYNTIKKHNGTIELKSEIGKGTIFAVKLPKLIDTQIKLQ